MTGLPESLKVFFAFRNEFSGIIDLRSLPAVLDMCLLECNHLSGSLDLRFLPNTIQNLSLFQNEFRQDVVVLPLDRFNIATLALDNGRFGSFVDTDGKEVRMKTSLDGSIVSLCTK